MGKSKKQFKRFESVAYIMLELIDKAVEMKRLQLDELKMKQQKELPKKYPLGGFVGGEISGRKHSQGREKYYNADGEKVTLMKDGENIIDEVKKAFPNPLEKYPLGGIVKKGLIFGTDLEHESYFISDFVNRESCDCPTCKARRKDD